MGDDATVLADAVLTAGTGGTGVEQTSEFMFADRALWFVLQLLLKVALLFQLLSQCAVG